MLNDLSFHCHDRDEALALFTDAVNGVLSALGDHPRAAFVCRDNNITDIQFSCGVTYGDIKEYLCTEDRDFFSLLDEFEDKSASDFIDDELLAFVGNFYCPSIKDVPTNQGNELDLILICSFTHSILMSLNTSSVWSNSQLHVTYYTDEKLSCIKQFYIDNISTEQHGIQWKNGHAPPDLPQLPRFFGNYSVRVFAKEHGIPHFHICCNATKLVSVAIEDYAIIIGRDSTEKSFQEALAWARCHQPLLRDCWKKVAQPGYAFYSPTPGRLPVPR